MVYVNGNGASVEEALNLFAFSVEGSLCVW